MSSDSIIRRYSGRPRGSTLKRFSLNMLRAIHAALLGPSMRWVALGLAVSLAQAAAGAPYLAPQGNAAEFSFYVLPNADSVIATPRKILEAVNAPLRNEAQATLWTLLGQPNQARAVVTRIPTDADIAFRSAAARGRPNSHNALADYVILSYPLPTDGTQLQQVTSVGTQLRSVGELRAVVEVVDGGFAALPIEQGGYLSNGVQPFDPSQQQWGMHVLRFPQAWEKIHGHAYVGAVESGIDVGHPDLQANFRPQFSRNVRTSPVSTNVSEDPGFGGHGTHVSGIIAATQDNVTQSVVGGCRHCGLSIIRSQGGANPLGIAAATDAGSQVINMSADGYPFTCDDPNSGQPTCAAIRNARARGVAMAASAGNSGNVPTVGQLSSLSYLTAPATAPGVMAVTGLQYNGLYAYGFWEGAYLPDIGRNFGSNWGDFANGEPQVSLIAPSLSVLSTFLRNGTWAAYASCGDPYGPPVASSIGYGLCTGTSMAAPHVSAAAALVKSANPLLIGDEVKKVLTHTAAPIGGEGKNRQGYGIPRVDAAVQATLDQGGGGRTNAVNRVTPLLGFFSSPSSIPFAPATPASYRAFNHFYTSAPQMGIAARVGAIQPSPMPTIEVIPPLAGQAVASWTYSCSTSCGASAAPSATLPGPLALRIKDTNIGIEYQPVPSLASPFLIRLTATSPANGLSVNGWVTGAINGPVVQTTLALGGSNVQWTITATAVEYLDFPVAFESYGRSVPGYANLTQSPVDPSVQAGDGTYAGYTARGVAGLMTTHRSPFADVADSAVVPLYRLSRRCGMTGTSGLAVCNPASPSYLATHVARVYATPETLSSIQSSGYQLDGIEGYLFGRQLASAPPGTAKLCQRYNATTDDYAMFLETDAVQGCDSTTPPFHASTLNGVLSNYSANADAAGFLGYAFTDLTPRPLFKALGPLPANLGEVVTEGGFETPQVQGAGNPEYVTPEWEFIGEAGLQANGFAGSATAPQGLQTAWVRNAGRLRTVVKLLPGNYTLSFSAARAASGSAPTLRVSLGQSTPLTVGAGINFATYNYNVSVSETGEYALLFEGAVRQQRHTDADPSAVTLIDQVSLRTACNLDTDGDGAVLAHTDGAALMRVLQSLPVDAIAANVRNTAQATFTSAETAERALAQLPWLDVDGNGVADYATDGLLLIRALLGFSGTSVTNGAVGASALRADWPAVRSYLAGTCGLTTLAP